VFRAPVAAILGPMRIRVGVVVAGVGLVLCAAAGGASAAPEHDMVVRMGKGIGRAHLGMTLRQTRRALGGPHSHVYRSLDFGTHGRYLELGWEFPGRVPWEPVTWEIGFRSWSRSEPLRVTRVATTARTQRTPQRLGIGARPRQLVRSYPQAACVQRPYPGMPQKGTWIVVTERSGAMTAFQLAPKGFPGPSPTPLFVVSVMVQRDWFSKPAGHTSCSPGWERW
jgi:hypothetical protein